MAERGEPIDVSAPGPSAGFRSVSVGPGLTRFTVIALGLSSRPSALVRPMSAVLLIAYGEKPGNTDRSATLLPMLMIRPPAGICLTAACAARNGAATRSHRGGQRPGSAQSVACVDQSSSDATIVARTCSNPVGIFDYQPRLPMFCVPPAGFGTELSVYRVGSVWFRRCRRTDSERAVGDRAEGSVLGG